MYYHVTLYNQSSQFVRTEDFDSWELLQDYVKGWLLENGKVEIIMSNKMPIYNPDPMLDQIWRPGGH